MVYPLKAKWLSPGSLVTLVVPVTTFTLLGNWQIRRHKWKHDLLEQIEKWRYSQPVDLLSLMENQSIESIPLYTKVKCTGTFDHQRQILLESRANILGNQAAKKHWPDKNIRSVGVHVITPFELSYPNLPGKTKNRRILVNRGFVPMNMKNLCAEGPRPSTIIGYVTPSETYSILNMNSPKRNHWCQKIVGQMAEHADTENILVTAEEGVQ
ncbi:hypothetical protein ACOME3_004625 [Neoechinorhynchus agilis]